MSTARLAVVTLATIVNGCGRVGFDEGTDATAACSSWGPFSAPTRLAGPFRTAADEWFPTPSSDELELYFYAVVGSTFDIVRSTRATRLDQFSAATAIGGARDGARRFDGVSLELQHAGDRFVHEASWVLSNCKVRSQPGPTRTAARIGRPHPAHLHRVITGSARDAQWTHSGTVPHGSAPRNSS
jgi:hypothetical protein